MIKKKKIWICIIVLILFVSACRSSNVNKANVDASIIGAWKKDDYKMVFRKDGICECYLSIYDDHESVFFDTYETNGTTLITKSEGESEEKVFEYQIIGNQLILMTSDGQKIVYFRCDGDNPVSDDFEQQEEFELIFMSGGGHNFSDGVAWVKWQGDWLCVDTKGNVLFVLDYNYEPVSDYINGFAVVQNINLYDEEDKDRIIYQKGNALIDKAGQIVLDSTEERNILKIGKNGDGIDVWTLYIIDTYSTYLEYLMVLKTHGIDENGELSFDECVFYDLPERSNIYYDIKNVGDGMYYFKYREAQGKGKLIYNTNKYSNEFTELSDAKGLKYYIDYCEIDEGWDYLGYSDGLITGNGGIVDEFGNQVIQFYSPGIISSTGWTGCYSEGLYSVGRIERNTFICDGFYNIMGNKVIDLAGYKTYRPPFYKNGYCVLRLKNDAYIDYFTVLDQNGNRMFEPQKGQAMGDGLESACYVTEDIFIVYDYDNLKYKYVDIYGNDVLEDYQYFADWNGNGVLGKFYDGLALVRINRDGIDGFIYIDSQGNELKLNLSSYYEKVGD